MVDSPPSHWRCSWCIPSWSQVPDRVMAATRQQPYAVVCRLVCRQVFIITLLIFVNVYGEWQIILCAMWKSCFTSFPMTPSMNVLIPDNMYTHPTCPFSALKKEFYSFCYPGSNLLLSKWAWWLNPDQWRVYPCIYKPYIHTDCTSNHPFSLPCIQPALWTSDNESMTGFLSALVFCGRFTSVDG